MRFCKIKPYDLFIKGGKYLLRMCIYTTPFLFV